MIKKVIFNLKIQDIVVIGRRIRTLSFILIFFGISSISTAHPHVFINAFLSIDFNDSGVCGIGVRWDFDEMFTELMLEEYDADANGIFDDNEKKRLYNEAFVNLKEFGFFTKIFVGNNRVEYSKTENFKAYIKDGQMIYEFYIPLSINISSDSYKLINICPYDETYYMDVYLDEEEPVTFLNNDKFDLNYSIEEDENMAYYFGQIYPQVIHLKAKKK
ncbi:MAG: hypothetical protein DRI86_05075 [Bacteroidetes bacterium]|nr:MAG: hypothetical protein DRI86_05075 [Bacteroidota bacterium]